MNYALQLEPLFAWQTIALVCVPAVLLLVIFAYQRQRGWVLRLAAIAALVLALLNPVVLQEDRAPLKSVVALVVDESPSQAIADRAELTREAAENIESDLAATGRFEVRTVHAAGNTTPDESTETRLFDALQGALADVPPSRVGGAIMITDGQVHDRPGVDAAAVTPLHALITGAENEFDRRLRFERAPRFGIVGQTLDLTYRVLSSRRESGTVNVEIHVNGDAVAVDQVRVGEETTVSVTIPNAGRNIIELRMPVAPGELSGTNNQAVALVDGIRENLRVLLVSGEPHSGERTWRNLLKADSSVDLVHFTILRPPEKQDGTPINELSLIAFPTRELFVEKIHEFDLIIFDRYQHRDVLPILYYDYIAEYVRSGGALLIAAGPEFSGIHSIAQTPLLSALPAMPNGSIIEQGFLPELTERGKRHPVTRGLEGAGQQPPAWSRWFRIIGVDHAEGEVVMQGPDERPLLLLSRMGEGRVGMFLSDQAWLWARGFEGGGPYVSLYRRIAHWLMKQPELEEERLTVTGRGMGLEILRQTMGDAITPAQIRSPSGVTREVTLQPLDPGLFSATVPVDEVGLYEITQGDLTALAHVGPTNAPEFADIASTEAVLEPITEARGGSTRRIRSDEGELVLPKIVPLRADAAVLYGRDWIGLRETGDTVLLAVHRVPLFAGFAGLGLLLLLLGGVWYRESR